MFGKIKCWMLVVYWKKISHWAENQYKKLLIAAFSFWLTANLKTIYQTSFKLFDQLTSLKSKKLATNLFNKQGVHLSWFLSKK